MRRAVLTCVATAALVIAAPAVASAASLNHISSSPFTSASSASVRATRVVAHRRAQPRAHAANAVYVECPIYLLPGENCCVAYNQYWGTSAVTFYSSGAGPITKTTSYRGPDTGTTERWRGTPSFGEYSTSFYITGPNIQHAETYAC